MDKAIYVGTVGYNFLEVSKSNWQPFITNDIIEAGVIKQSPYHLLTLGSGVGTAYSSLATTPNFALPTHSQFYLAGRDLLRWGGPSSPREIDIDHYGFTPDPSHNSVVVWKSPKSVPHHLSQRPDLLSHLPPQVKELFETVLKGDLP